MRTYIAKRAMKVMTDDGVVGVKPGDPVDVSSWSDRVLRANLNLMHIEEIETPDAPRPKRGRSKKKAAA